MRAAIWQQRKGLIEVTTPPLDTSRGAKVDLASRPRQVKLTWRVDLAKSNRPRQVSMLSGSLRLVPYTSRPAHCRKTLVQGAGAASSPRAYGTPPRHCSALPRPLRIAYHKDHTGVASVSSGRGPRYCCTDATSPSIGRSIASSLEIERRCGLGSPLCEACCGERRQRHAVGSGADESAASRPARAVDSGFDESTASRPHRRRELRRRHRLLAPTLRAATGVAPARRHTLSTVQLAPRGRHFCDGSDGRLRQHHGQRPLPLPLHALLPLLLQPVPSPPC